MFPLAQLLAAEDLSSHWSVEEAIIINAPRLIAQAD